MSNESMDGRPDDTQSTEQITQPSEHADEDASQHRPWQDAFVKEKQSILERRKVAFEVEDAVDTTSSEVENLTGLALSGGGIRSALFNDGFLQALSHRGLLRYVDYLSTVSGGGYIGGHLTSCGVLKEKQARAEKARSTDPGNETHNKSFHGDERYWNLGKDPVSGKVNPKRLENIGGYLEKSGTFVTRYFTTQIFVFCVYFGAVAAAATLAALFWRSFDHEDFRFLWNIYGLSTWGGEVSLAFYPAIWLTIVWLGGSFLRLLTLIPSIASYCESTEFPWLDRTSIASIYIWFMKWLGVAILASILIGIAVTMGNGITNVKPIEDDEFIHLNRFAEILALLAGVMQLLVFFGRDKLFRSEQSEAATWQKLANKALSLGVAVLLFFSLVHWMAREDISGYTISRDAHLVRQDIRDWHGLARLFEGTRIISPDPLASKMKEYDETRSKLVSASRWQNKRPSSAQPDPKSPFFENDPKEFLKSNWTSTRVNFGKLSLLFFCQFYGYDNGVLDERVGKALKQTTDLRLLQSLFLNSINSELERPEFTIEIVDRLKKRNSKQPKGILASLDQSLYENFVPQDLDNKKRELYSLEELEEIFTPIFKEEAQRTRFISNIQRVIRTSESTIELSTAERQNNASLNRRLLEILHPSIVMDHRVASTPVVISHDQSARVGWLICFTTLFILGFIGTCNLNWQNSIYHFYRKQLNNKFLQGWFEGIEESDSKVDLNKSFALTDCDATAVGLPYPLMLGTWMRREKSRLVYHPFLFTPKLVGIVDRYEMIHSDTREDAQCTDEYELVGLGRKLDLGDAVAISGSAVTPLMTKNIWLSILLDFFGVGLGQWFRRPKKGNKNKNWLVGYITQISRYFRKDDTFGFVADGGYEDVLGAYELLRRRCELIIVSDACCNTNQDELGALAKMLETANANLGIQFFDLDHESPIDYGRLLKDKDSNLPQNHILMRVRYPDNQGEQTQRDGLLVYSQMGITEQDPIEIRQIKKKFPAFPDEPTSNQFYTQEQVAAYQKLGYYIGQKICSDLVRWSPEDIEMAEKHRIKMFCEESDVSFREFYGRDSRDMPVVAPEDSDDPERLDDFRKNFDKEPEPSQMVSVLTEEETTHGFTKIEEKQMRSMKNQPLFDVIHRRLLTGYRLACFEEDDYETTDIFSEAVWDRNEWCFISFRDCVESIRTLVKRVGEVEGYEAKLEAIEAVCLEWTRIYQTNADVCAVYRNLVFMDVNGGMLSTEGDGSKSRAVVRLIEQILGVEEDVNSIRTSEEENRPVDFQRAVISAAHFAAVAMACQQFHRGKPRAIFQVGGREKLMDLVASLFFTVKRRLKNEKQLRTELPPGPQRGQEQALLWWDWLKRNCPELIEMKTGVFNNTQVESIVSFSQVLILHLQSLQNWTTTNPPNTVLIRKRLFDAVSNFGIGEAEAIRGLDQIVADLFEGETTLTHNF